MAFTEAISIPLNSLRQVVPKPQRFGVWETTNFAVANRGLRVYRSRVSMVVRKLRVACGTHISYGNLLCKLPFLAMPCNQQSLAENASPLCWVERQTTHGALPVPLQISLIRRACCQTSPCVHAPNLTWCLQDDFLDALHAQNMESHKDVLMENGVDTADILVPDLCLVGIYTGSTGDFKDHRFGDKSRWITFVPSH